MKALPKSVLITLVLILLNAVFWFGYMVVTMLDGTHLTSVPTFVRGGIMLLALGAAIILSVIAMLLKRRNRWGFYAGVGMLTLIALLSITDEFGVLDFFSLLMSLVPLGLMLKERGWYLKPQGYDDLK